MGSRKFSAEEKGEAIRLYKEGLTLTQVVRQLGYPSLPGLIRWLEAAGCLRGKHQFHHHTTEEILNALRRCFTDCESVDSVAKDIGVDSTTIYKWARVYKKEGTQGFMKKRSRKELLPVREKEEPNRSIQDVEYLKAQLQEMQMEIDILKATIDVIKKDPGVDSSTLRNREKAAIVGALRNRYPLPLLLTKLDLVRSSYYYQQSKKETDRYALIRQRISAIFHENREVFGYRRIHLLLKREGIIVSEKVVRRIMKQEGLTVKIKKKKKYNSYIGEISPAVENLINRQFHSEKPNQKWLTDITEFSIDDGKVYLSTIIDCLDGMPVSWKTGTSPDAELANTTLETAILTLKPDEKPIVHSDRGCQYRWPGWIRIMNQSGLIRSMSKKGCSPDNSACEGFFGHLKNEMFYNRTWKGATVEELIESIEDYMNWYCKDRIKLTLGGLSPFEYRQSIGCSV